MKTVESVVKMEAVVFGGVRYSVVYSDGSWTIVRAQDELEAFKKAQELIPYEP